jgi:ribosome-binding factor A
MNKNRTSTQIKRIMADIFIQDNNLALKKGYITVLQADVSPDAKNAKIFIDVFDADGKKIIKDLRKLAPYLRHELAKKINLRFTPELAFVLDETSGQVNKIEDLIKEEAEKLGLKK